MRLEITGKIEETEVERTLGAAIGKWMLKLQSDNAELMDQFEQLEGAHFTKITADVAFTFAGQTEPQVITTDNHEGIPELLVVTAETDDDGKLIWDSVKDNDGDSLFTEVEAAVAAGLPKEFEEIESALMETATLHIVGTVEVADYLVTVLLNEGSQTVLQITKDGKLISETFYEGTEEAHTLLQHYQELAKVLAA